MKTSILSLILSALSLSALALDFDQSWKAQKFPFRAANQYSLDGASLGVQSSGSVSLLYRPLYVSASQASWNWEVTQSVAATPLRNKGGDDRNLSIYFVFAPASDAETAKGQGIVKLLQNPNTKGLIYTYGGTDGRGTIFQSPYGQGRGAVIVKAPAGAGSGSESVNLADDFRSIYGTAPEVLVGVAISADSDDTKGAISARISNLTVQ